MSSLRVALWNLEWAKPASDRARDIRRHLASADPDFSCLTESHADLVTGGHQVEGEEDWGYPIRPGRRKVLLWSRWPWRATDRVGHPSLPPGRFVSATTDTPLGPVDVIGVCIPWSHAHVAGGRRDRRPWKDRLQFLDGLAPVFASKLQRPRILLGDFNQWIPRVSQPAAAFAALEGALGPWFTVATAGVTDGGGHAAIDHLAHTPDLAAAVRGVLPGREPDGPRLSDQLGLVVDVRRVDAIH